MLFNKCKEGVLTRHYRRWRWKKLRTKVNTVVMEGSNEERIKR
jgi:hypothetical protein